MSKPQPALTNTMNNVPVATPVTVCIGSDRYAAKVVKSTRCTCTVEYTLGGLKGKMKIFRLTDDGYTCEGRQLEIGEAVYEMDRSH